MKALGLRRVLVILAIVLPVAGIWVKVNQEWRAAEIQAQRDAQAQKAVGEAIKQLKKTEEGSEEEVLSQKLIGTWESRHSSDGGPTISLTETFIADGTSTGAGTIVLNGKTTAWSVSGSWRIEGKKINEKVTQSSLLPVGKTWSDEILKLTDEELVTRAHDGEIETRHRMSK